MRFERRIIACLLLILAMSVSQMYAQVTSAGSIAGQVTDQTGAVLPDVSLTAVQTQTHAQWQTTSDAAGNYIFPNLTVGTFILTAKKANFSKQEVNSIIINAGQNQHINISLKPGAVTETVEVSSDAVSVDTETANVGNVVDSTSIQALPLVTRNFTQLVAITPGISSDIGSENGFGSNSSLAASANGVRENSNNWTIDSVPNVDVYNANNAIIPDIDAIGEFRIDRGNYSAEQGRSAGATINVILKTGTNAYHGTFFEFARNTSLNANNYFSNRSGIERSADHYNNWGYTVGGPIKKDKLFFFWSEEWRHIIESSGTYQTRVPTAAEKSGDFSDYATLSVPEPVVPSSLNGKCTGCVTGQPFPSDQIPSSLISSNAKAILNTYYPTANTYIKSEGYNYSSAKPTTTTVREELIRLDYNINSNWKLFAHYIQDQNHITSPYQLWNDNVLPDVAGSTEFEPLHSFAFNVLGTLTPNLINEIQFGIYHNVVRISMNPTIARSNASGLDIPYYFSDHTNTSDRIPNLSFTRYGSITSDFPFLNGFFYHKWSDNLSWHRNNHDFRFGVLVTQQGKNENNSNSLTNGSFTFTGTKTGNDLSDMLIGYTDEYSESKTNPMQHLRYWDFEAFAQDQWHIVPRVSLTYGLRYTYYSPATDENSLLSSFLPSLYKASDAPTVNADGTLSNIPTSQMSSDVYLPSNGIIQADVNSPFGSSIYKSTKLNLSPRVGVAWDVFGNQKTSVQAGYGRYFDRVACYELGTKGNPPNNETVTIYNTSVDTPSSGSNNYYAASLTALNTKYKLPYNQQWSLGVQQQLAKNTVLNVSYVGTKGTHLLYESQLNQNDPTAAIYNYNQTGLNEVNVDQYRPYLGYGAIAYYTPEGSSNYHGLQASVQHQLGSSLTANAAYTLSKVLTNASTDTYSPQDSKNPSADRGLAAFDRRHMFVLNYVWQLPKLSNDKNAILRGSLNGWAWSGILRVTSGVPVTVTTETAKISGVTDSTQRPNIVGKAQDGKGVDDWLNYNSFENQTPGTFGNSPVSVAHQPRETQFDSSLSKNFHLYQTLHMEFKLEAINALNHTLFSAVDHAWYENSTTFGHITSATTPRTAQVGLHFTF